jgi:predicted SAM-dependent methyltransferase
MNGPSYLNVGCGHKHHRDWTNIDMSSDSPFVLEHDLLRGIPFPENTFDAVYHSQVLEHFEREKAPAFIGDCFRVLKPGGILRLVVPDLENIAREYLKNLNAAVEKPGPGSEADYDWILLEMYDQTVRNRRGGLMAEFLARPDLVNERYVLGRVGRVAMNARNGSLSAGAERPPLSPARSLGFLLRRTRRKITEKLMSAFGSDAHKTGVFRRSGEVHLWMYDRFSLSRLLARAGFARIEVKTPFESGIPRWAEYELDVKDGIVFDPTSLFMEGFKPV